MTTKFKVYKPNEESERTTYFDLHKDADGGMVLRARDGYGSFLSSILEIQSDGTLHKIPNIRDDIGLQLDKEGRIIERS